MSKKRSHPKNNNAKSTRQAFFAKFATTSSHTQSPQPASTRFASCASPNTCYTSTNVHNVMPVSAISVYLTTFCWTTWSWTTLKNMSQTKSKSSKKGFKTLKIIKRKEGNSFFIKVERLFRRDEDRCQGCWLRLVYGKNLSNTEQSPIKKNQVDDCQVW